MVNTLISTSLYLFEEVFQKKLSKNEIFFVISPKISLYVSSSTVRTGYY
jgi:hypothetical protein